MKYNCFRISHINVQKEKQTKTASNKLIRETHGRQTCKLLQYTTTVSHLSFFGVINAGSLSNSNKKVIITTHDKTKKFRNINVKASVIAKLKKQICDIKSGVCAMFYKFLCAHNMNTQSANDFIYQNN